MYDDDRIIINLTLWETVRALRQYVYKGAHHAVLRDRKRWFTKFDDPYYALWWIPAGQLPTAEDGKRRLEHLRQHGALPYAFSFKNVFPAPAG